MHHEHWQTVARMSVQERYCDESMKHSEYHFGQNFWSQLTLPEQYHQIQYLDSTNKATKLIDNIPPTTPTKAKRVRTGCLTCRERHLKCDEAVPDCVNCRKRGRECKRGLRLNFLDINLHEPVIVSSPGDWIVDFKDESRDIASEYRDGLRQYAPYEIDREATDTFQEHRDFPKNTIRHVNSEPKPTGRVAFTPESSANNPTSPRQVHRNHSRTTSDVSNIATPSSSKSTATNTRKRFKENPHLTATGISSIQESFIPVPYDSSSYPNDGNESFGKHFSRIPLEADVDAGGLRIRDVLTSPEQVYYIQAFVQYVGVWMDSFEGSDHFIRTVPYQALDSNMLLNALTACGAKHASSTSPNERDKALFYYNTATTQLLRNLQNPDRNTAECATAAVVLNAYEIMSEKPSHRMSHIAGARALMRECGWDAKISGVGAACFWLNVGTEVLNCLVSKSRMTWDPEEWGVCLRDADSAERVWVQRMIYIAARVANFQAVMARADENIGGNDRVWMEEWQVLADLCDGWDRCCPGTMHPYSHVKPSKPGLDSPFPQIWMINREATIGRLLYHTTQCLLQQIHSLEPFENNPSSPQLYHALQVCGIVNSTTSRGVNTIATRCLAIAAAILPSSREQCQVLEMLDRKGWRVGGLEAELKRAWGWKHPRLPLVAEVPTLMRVRKGVVNPLRFADFSLPNHPYQNWYEPPSRAMGQAYT